MATFRPANGADVDALCELMRAYYAEEGYPFDAEAARRAFGELLSSPVLGRVWLALDGDSPVGYIALTLGYSLEHRGRDAFIDEVYILPSHRGRGLGSAAMALAERACRALGVRALHLEVERGEGKALARGMYRRAGFGDRGRKLMTKRLSIAPPDAVA